MIIDVNTVKGFQDFLPPESIRRKEIKRIMEKYFSLYGFVPIETPVVEFDEIMRSDSFQIEDEAISDRFRLKDRGGRNLGLRYEFTFQLARIFKLNPNLKLPLRRYQIGENFRDEPISAGRFRQFTQCDVDIIGDSSIDADAEIISIVSDILKELQIESNVVVNNKKLLMSIIESVQIQDRFATMKEIDKLDKIGEDNVKSNLRKYADVNQIITLFKLLEKDIAFFVENKFEGAEEIDALDKKCKKYGIKIKFSPILARGLSYYTGNIFEIKYKDGGSIAGGGRYDKSVGKYLNREIPAVGLSFGLERVSSLAKLDLKPQTKAVLISFGKDIQSIRLAQILRKAEVSCILFSEKPGKALDFANSQGIPYAIFIGDEEIAKKKFKLKNMLSGEEKYLSEKQVVSVLKKV